MVAKKRNNKKRILFLAGLILLIIFACLCYWKRRGIRNTFYRMTIGHVPIEIKEKEQMKIYGYYKQAIKADTDLDHVTVITEKDNTADAFETTIPVESTLVADSHEIDSLVEAELDNDYTWEEPMVILNPYRISPLTGLILFQTDEEVGVRVTVKGKTEAADIVGELEPATRHRVPMVGLYPNMENTVVLELLDDQGEIKESQEIKVQTGDLPEKLKGKVTPVETAGESAYALTMVYGQDCKLPFAYDCNGDIRWYFEKESGSYGLYNLSDGRIIFHDTAAYVPSQEQPQATNLYEMDYLGRAYKLYYIPNGSHHDVIEKEPGGNLLVLTGTLKNSYKEKIVELDRETGEIVNELELADIFGKTYVDAIDWAHLNTISYQPEGDTIIISARNLHSAIKIDWTTHEIVWILCDPEFWKGTEFEKYVLQPEGDFVYHFQQHSTYQLEADLDGNPETVELSLFDNHQMDHRKVDYYDNNDASYAIVYSIDENAGTVKQIKKLAVQFSHITSNTVYDAQSNHIFGMCGKIINDAGKEAGMTYEFDYDSGELLNQFYINEDFYRASELALNFEDLSRKMEEQDGYIVGTLRAPVKTTEKAAEPEEMIGDEVSFKMVGSVLYVGAQDHHISQIIFKGNDNTWVYDSTDIRLHAKAYLKHYQNIPVPLSDLEADTYQIYCVYDDVYYQTGQSFTRK